MYGCEIWEMLNKNRNKLNTVQSTAIHNFLGVHARSMSDYSTVLYIELESRWTPIRLEIQFF
jgi:hypothetical protein